MISQIPNILTISRLLLFAPIVYCIFAEHWLYVLLLMIVAGLTDFADGLFARKFDWTSRFGRLVDPIADKVTFAGTFLVLWVQGHIPTWLAMIVFSREVLILGGLVVYRLVLKQLDVEPTFISKVNTYVLVLLVLALIYSMTDLVGTDLAKMLLEPLLFWMCAILTIASGLDYVRVWGTKALRLLAERNN